MKNKVLYFMAGMGAAAIMFSSRELSEGWQAIINNLIF